MKPSRLIALLLLAATSSMAADTPQATPTNHELARGSQTQILGRKFSLPTTGFLTTAPRGFITLEMPLPDNVCLTMRTYVYQRVDGGDATEQVAYHTCTPASRAQLRRTDRNSFKLKK